MTFNLLLAVEAISLDTKSTDILHICQRIKESIENQTVNFEYVVKQLSEKLLDIETATLFRKHLSNILLPIVSEKIPLKPVFSSDYLDANDTDKLQYLKYSIILATLCDHPDILLYAVKFFDVNNVSPFHVYINHKETYKIMVKKRRMQKNFEDVKDYEIIKLCYVLLKNMPNEFSTKWDWSEFVDVYSNHENNEIRWMVKECMVILTNMSEKQSKLLSTNMKLNEKDSFNLIRKHDEKNKIVSHASKDNNKIDLNTKHVLDIDGIMLPVYDYDNVLDGYLVPVKSTIDNLRSLALAVASGKALSLMGPVGSGKTSLVEYLAAKTGRKGVAFKKVQLGDQTDSRMLLGSHQCTDVPGEFVWRPGVLTEAVQNGHWLLLEDIDCAALDVASTLSSLLERNSLCVPGYRDSLPVSSGFQLFVTQRTVVTNFGFQKKMSSSSTLLQKHLTQINVEPLSRSELAEIIQKLYPRLSTICSRMIEVFMMFSVGSHDNSLQNTDSKSSDDKNVSLIRGSRLISTRDLMKWCSRAVVGFDVTSPESALKVLQDALDIFTCSVASPESRLELAKKVGSCLGIVETKSEFYCKHYKPNVSLQPDVIEVGRARVVRKEKSLESLHFDSRQTVFSFTRQSACLLERIACCVMANEPVLLVGETGTGKTSSVQYIAKQTGHKLVVINMNQQSDSADLLGGYKPVDMKYVIRPIKNEFEDLFKSFYNVEKNQKFLSHISNCFETENWTALVALMKQSQKSAVTRMNAVKKLNKWVSFGAKLAKLEQQVKAASRLTFAFIEGSLVKAMQEGHWVLLDEINLASAEILECLAGLLEDKNESVELLEKGDKVPIKRHPDFTLFACMNPATDVGKKDLPVGLRNRFTEFFIDELTERNDLMLLIGDYLYHMNLDSSILEAIYLFYSNIKKEAKLNLVDGSGNAPHYSLRTLCRALSSSAKAKCGSVSRSLFEAFCLSFLTQLDSSSHPKVEAMIAKAVIGKKNIKSVMNQLIPEPQIQGQNFLLFEGHWIPQGKLDIQIPEGYILTATVKKNLRDIARVISLGRLPILLQGDTSVGKTSLITYIAKASGNYCVRINNHEHTDLQEYVGSYASDADGKLVFKEGVLVEAMRKGHWIILDELNLAPSDVLEALNRVLDDNRELYIPETQQVIRADPNFMLFATQNPPGLYGGRKMLSRAFRNRFVELHFDEIPKNELETILHQRCHIPPTYSKKMIAVMAELQTRRRGSAAVQGKDGFITLRDLFRWGQRYKLASKEILTENKFYDWDQHIADEGYLILAGKVRQTEERKIIEEVIEKHIKRKVDPNNLFSLSPSTSPVTKSILEVILNNQLTVFSHVVWTYNMRRLAVLIAKSFNFNEPVLLVGETGCGKTTICQVLAALKKAELLSVNCHMHTESSDFLGGLRPVRQRNEDGRLFEWVDGPLIKAMESGNMFLADEISLSDDSVLERLNSLLEPERQLVLAERGMDDTDVVVITAAEGFHFVGTMNPGGDFGKKELSPALRNRFTEIWCDSVTSREDLHKVLEKSVNKDILMGNQEDGSSGIGNCILDFTEWLKNSEVTNKFPFSIRDLLSWVSFINATVEKGLLSTPEAYVHGACMTFLDCFGTTLTGHIENETLNLIRDNSINFLLNQIKHVAGDSLHNLRTLLSDQKKSHEAEYEPMRFGIRPFYIEAKPRMHPEKCNFSFSAPTTGSNTLRLLRGLQLNKAVLLEGNPGVGKTSLVTALAKASGHKVVRINLSDQTDITDLFGTDLPSENGSFQFKEGAFLSALQNGDWILLDELNLAPQPVLEGLNACLDHRGEIFIPELGKTFQVKKQTRLFACQNPLKQGGARRGLPISFLNRFTQVYVDTLTQDDLQFIVEVQYPTIPKDILNRIVKFNCKIAHEITVLQSWAHRGGPWEMNLRDIQRWCDALLQDQNSGLQLSPGKFVGMLYVNRMRTADDKQKMSDVYNSIFCPEYPQSYEVPQFKIDSDEVIIGDVRIDRRTEKQFKTKNATETHMLVLRNQLSTLKAITQSVKMNWLSILVGPTSTGKSSLIETLSYLTGNDLNVVPVTSAMDVSDLLGGFEQVDYNRTLENLFEKIEILTVQILRNLWLNDPPGTWNSKRLLGELHQYKKLQNNSNDLENFVNKIDFLKSHCSALIAYTNAPIDIQKVILRLNNLKMKINKLKSVNIGGKFEWVDSLLVKTMIEGSWLLLDNVNLTSAAVLDRLNGLLEPKGVLTIPERGELSDIVPHPNFRIFFTMDPKHGEISRAMRNRGVEIFILTPEDRNANIEQTMPYLDMIGLLASCGLPEEYFDICIKSHELLSSYVSGLDKPTISHLLQAAHLTWQQINRGIDTTKAIINSFSDVYIKPRSGSDFASNMNMPLAEVKNTMLNNLIKMLSNNIDKNCTVKDHTLAVKELCSNSTFATVKQNCYPIVQNHLNASHSRFTLLSIYCKSSSSIIELINDFINRVSTNDNTKILNDITYKKIQKLDVTINTFKRFYPESYMLTTDEIKAINIKSLLMYFDLLRNSSDHASSKEKIFSVFDYSKAVLSGNLTDDFLEYPILKYCQYYLQIIDEYIENSIKLAEMNMEDDKVAELFQLLNWRSRFISSASVPILKNKKTRVLNEDIIPLLYMHSKWLQKYLMQPLFTLLPLNNDLEQKFKSTTANLITHSDHNDSTIMKLSKKYRKLYGQPKLYSDEEEYKATILRSQIYDNLDLDIALPLERQTAKLLDKSALTNHEVALDIPNNIMITYIQEQLSKIENQKDKLTIDQKLSPVNAYIVQRIINTLQNYIFDVVRKLQKDFTEYDTAHVPMDNTFSELLKYLVYATKMCRGFPSSLLDLMEVLLKLESGGYDNTMTTLSSVTTRFWNEYYKESTNSIAYHPMSFLRTANGEESPINSFRVSPNLPLMPFYGQKLTVFDSSDENYRHLLAFNSVSLQDRAEYSVLLDSMLNIMWKNVAALHSSAVSRLQSNALFELKRFEQLVHYIYQILSNKQSESQHIDLLIEDTINILKNYLNPEEMSFVQFVEEAYKIYTSIKVIVQNNEIKNNGDIIKMYTAQIALITSVLSTKIVSEISPVDHVEKYRLKLSYIEEDINMFNTILSTYYIHGLVTGTMNSSAELCKESFVKAEHYETFNPNNKELVKVHPYCEHVLALREKTAGYVNKYALGNTFRPKEISYTSFVKECTHFTKSVLSSKTLVDVTKQLISITNELNQCIQQNTYKKDVLQRSETILKATLSWMFSINSFYKKIETNYSNAYPDLAQPLLCWLTQIRHSVTSLTDLVKESLVVLEQGPYFTDAVLDLMVYPVKVPTRDSLDVYLNRFITTNFINLLNKCAQSSSDNHRIAEAECLELLKMNLTELKMYCYSQETVSKECFDAVSATLNAIVKAWEKQQRDIEQKMIEDEALYVTKSKCEDEDEDQQNLEEIMEMFPSYSETDFSEFKNNTLEQKADAPQQKEKRVAVKSSLLLNHEVITLVYNWHVKFVKNMTVAEWLPAAKKVAGVDVLASLMQRYPLFSRVIQNGWQALDAELEGQLSPTMMVMIAQIKAKVDGEDESNEKHDFYRSPWVSETKQCHQLLIQVKESVDALLDQWPDFPTLKDIILIVNRILSFPVTSPVARFLTGFELLRDKIEEWNKNAHKGNNLIDISLAVGGQIINWRKLEMSQWKECLNNLFHSKQTEAHKYWFFLYEVIESYMSPQSEDMYTADKITNVLKDFMEKSNLVEYEARLEMLYAYHCHLVHLDRSERRDELLSILWNTHNYYGQFSQTINAKIKEKRAPIEKKLRDFVKICTWDRDLSYWSVKDTVDKAHKALHKNTKEFENILKEPALPWLVDTSIDSLSEHVGLWDRPKRSSLSLNTQTGGAYMVDTQNFILHARTAKKYLDEAEQPCAELDESSLLTKIPNLLNKAKTLCKDTMSRTKYPSLVQSLDDFVTSVIETSTHLGGLEVEESASKEKQTSQAKNILQQKRKALADLFRYLTKMGLNYRTGLVVLSAETNLYDFGIAPVDLNAALSYLKNRRCDTALSLIWSGCEKYFQKNLSRHKTFTSAMLTPHQDLGMQNIDRCKGFSAQLLKMTNNQKKSISKYSRHLCDLRSLSASLTNILEINEDTNIMRLNEKVDLLTHLYGNTGLVLGQFSVLLNSYPEMGLPKDNVPEFDKVLSNSPIVRCHKNSEEWQHLYSKIKKCITTVDKQKAQLFKLRTVLPNVIGNEISVVIASQNSIDVTNDAKECMYSIKNELDQILIDYQFSINNEVLDHPLLTSLVSLNHFIDKSLNEYNYLNKREDINMEDNLTESNIITDTEDLIATLLLSIQSVYKQHLPDNASSSCSDIIQSIDEIIEQKEILEDNHLKVLLEEKLTNDVKALHVENINKKVHKILTNYVEYVSSTKKGMLKSVILRLMPILEQIVLLVQYFITQQVAVHRVSCKMLSVLLKIFTDLAAKGFCKPSDLDMEEGDGEGGPGKMTGGTGLGDGEGKTDVSERIEDQDQLDDARRPGEERNEEDKDCKEEEKGVNMTDDFESHLQDVDKKEDDEQDQNDDNEDADKQMGDTDNAAEKLDQQIWGDQNEEDVQEQNNKEEKGKGESTGEKEMAAKEQEQGVDDGDSGKEKKDKKDVNEMNEPEVDDDQVDPYHGNQQPLPEPEDFEMPDNMDLDGEEPGEDKDGETETENPFEIEVTKDNIPEENEEGEKEKNNEGLEVSSDEGECDDGDGDELHGDEKDNLEKENDQDNAQNENQEDESQDDDGDDNEEGVETIKENETEDKQEDGPEDNDQNEDVKNNDLNNPEKIGEDENEETNPQAMPSNADNADEKAENAQTDSGTNDNVDTNEQQNKDENAAPYEQSQEQVGDERQAAGRSELDKSEKGHKGQKQAANKASEDKNNKKKENKPGSTDQERTLGDINESKKNKSHTLNVEKDSNNEEDAGGDEQDKDRDAEAYQHVKQAKKDDLQAIDAATKEQADEQPMIQENDESDCEELKYDEDIPMDVDQDDDVLVDNTKELSSEKTNDKSSDEKSGKNKDGGDEVSGETGIEIEGEAVSTEHVPRGDQSTFHTRLATTDAHEDTSMSAEQYCSIRDWLVSGGNSSGQVSSSVWRQLWAEKETQARALTETLRLILEPTGRTRKAGDFRTGRAINMRRVIPYIASHFRKDRIWLRRTKPAKREYKIAIAIDDSSSMSDNKSKQLAFESLALVSQALNLLESGDLSVLSFGEHPNLLHSFSEQFSEHSGAKILEKLRFEQTKTKIAQLLDFCTVMFEEQAVRSDAVNAKLLVIVSDGRGIFSEGETRVIQAVRRARQQGIFLVYLIVDNPDNKDSIMDIRRPVFDPVSGSLGGFVQYLDTFPFPFYLILRNITALPTVLGDALRQWFELAANTAN